MEWRFLPVLALGAALFAPASTAWPSSPPSASPLSPPPFALQPAADDVQSPPEGSQTPDWVTPPDDVQQAGRGERSFSIDTLFDALKIAPDAESAKAIEDRIWAVWMVSGSDTCNLLMARVKAAADDKDLDLAIQLLDAVIALKPDYTEGWNRRATLYYMKKDFGHALADIHEVLLLEPRHFGALSGLGLILQEIGDEKHALAAYRRALAIDPHLEHIGEVVNSLREKVEGRDI